MTEKRILFGKFEFPVEKGLEYLVNENIPETDFLLINEPHDAFSIIIEKDFPIFTVPEHSERDYFLFSCFSGQKNFITLSSRFNSNRK